MNKELSKILRERLQENGGLPFVERYAGLVQTVEKIDIDVNQNNVRKRFPVATESVLNGVCNSNEIIMTPDSSVKGIVYFEDGGTSPLGRVGQDFKFTSNLTLICWINRAKVVSNIYSEITAIAIQNIIQKLKIDQNPETVSFFKSLSVSLVKIQPQEASVFSRYPYYETVTQFLRPPFEFFALGLQLKYSINESCVEPLTITNEEVCY